MKISKLFLLFLISTILHAGCWDSREIEKRGFVVGMGFDTAAPSENDLEPVGKEGYEVILQAALPSQIAGTGEAGGGGDLEPSWNITSEGGTILEAIRGTYTSLQRVPFFAFTEVVIIGEELARRGIGESMDFLFREPGMRRRVVVYVTPGEPKKVLEVKPRLETINGIYLAKLVENENETNNIPVPMDLGKLEKVLREENSAYLLPSVLVGKEEVKVNGAAVFKGDKMLGWLEKEYTKAHRWITNKAKKDTIAVLLQDEKIVLDVSSARTWIMPKIEDERLKFIIRVRTEGSIGEIHISKKNLVDNDVLKEIEAAVAKQLEQMMLETISHVQQQYGVDIFGFSRSLEKRYPTLWKELEPRWDEVFPTLEVDVEIDVNIRRIGMER